MPLSDLTLKEKYRTGEQNLIEEFYRPCLAEASSYDRAVGYFKSTVFLIIGPDVISFAQRGGSIRLICSPALTDEDINAIQNGLSAKEEIVNRALEQDLSQLLASNMLRRNTEALATLVSLGILNIKIAIRPVSSGIYHDKLGIFQDRLGNNVVFEGSINETFSGWSERGNFESFTVFNNFIIDDQRDQERVIERNDYFERLWTGNRSPTGLEIVEFPEISQTLRSVAKEDLNEIDLEGLIEFSNHGTEETVHRPAATPITREPYEHQKTALENWKAQACRGILEHATGSGKTFTAILALREHLDNSGVGVVFVPGVLLLRQWFKELSTEIPDAVILLAGDNNNDWRYNYKLHLFSTRQDNAGKRIVLAILNTARTDTFLNGLSGGDHLLVIADEVHDSGSVENSRIFDIDAGLRLGLSATPRRFGDPEGTSRILDYFGDIVEPRYTLDDAIRDGTLVGYEYYPQALHFTAEEAEQYREETVAIRQAYARSPRDRDGNIVMSNQVKFLLIQRSRIAKKAQRKIDLVSRIVTKHYEDRQHWLVYCEDQEQLSLVMSTLRNDGYKPHEYHTNMAANDEAVLGFFRRHGGILVAIRCLDQGVDIPQISHAMILASSQNPRQFIQRRGRVLRKNEGKQYATIFDALVLPIDGVDEPEQHSLLKHELQRSILFAKSARNSSTILTELELIAIRFGIDLDVEAIEDTGGYEQ